MIALILSFEVILERKVRTPGVQQCMSTNDVANSDQDIVQLKTGTRARFRFPRINLGKVPQRQ